MNAPFKNGIKKRLPDPEASRTAGTDHKQSIHHTFPTLVLSRSGQRVRIPPSQPYGSPMYHYSLVKSVYHDCGASQSARETVMTGIQIGH